MRPKVVPRVSDAPQKRPYVRKHPTLDQRIMELVETMERLEKLRRGVITH